MKIFNQQQLQAWDKLTIEEYELDSIELIQQVSGLLEDLLEPIFLDDLTSAVHIFCGMGHNGADGLALANLICSYQEVDLYIVNHRKNSSPAFKYFFELIDHQYITIHHVNSIGDLDRLPMDVLVIDAMLGTGISRPLDGLLADVVQFLNEQNCHQKVALDYPTGLHPDKVWSGPAFKAHRTFTIASRRLASFFQENRQYLGHEIPVPLILSDAYYQSTQTNNYTLEILDLVMSSETIHSENDYKNTFGHVLFIGGSKGKMGAALMASEGAFRAGCGLVTAHVPSDGVDIMQIGLPEAMVSIDPHPKHITRLPDLNSYQTICIGCGLSADVTPEIIKDVLLSKPLKVLDADALNIISQHQELKEFLDESCVLTPHVGEFHRLFGLCKDSFERYNQLVKQAKLLGCYIILKGRHTMLATPSGDCFINLTGNITLATAGSGDILAGYIAGHLAQRYDMETACKRAICFHGYAGDLLLETHGTRGAIGRDILSKLGQMEVETSRLVKEFMDDMDGLTDFEEGLHDDFDPDDPLGLNDLDDDPFSMDHLNNPN